MSEDAIVAACRRQFDRHSDDCSGFVRAVAQDLGFQLVGNADGLMDLLAARWTKIDRRAAVDLARAGVFVIAGLRSADHNPPRSHGHVVVVVDGPLYHDKYPPAWGGSIGTAQSAGTKSVGEIWRKADRDAVEYFRPPPPPPANVPAAEE